MIHLHSHTQTLTIRKNWRQAPDFIIYWNKFLKFTFPQLPRHFRKCLVFLQLPRHFRKCLGISGNAWFPQIPATYTLLLKISRNWDQYAILLYRSKINDLKIINYTSKQNYSSKKKQNFVKFCLKMEISNFLTKQIINFASHNIFLHMQLRNK